MLFSSQQMNILSAASQGSSKAKTKHPSFVTAVIFKPTKDTMTGLYIGRRKRDNSFIIKNVTPNSLASGTELTKGMRLLLINSEPVLPDTMSLHDVAKMLTEASGVVTVTGTKVPRKKDPLQLMTSSSNRNKKDAANEIPDSALIKPPCFERQNSNNTHFLPPSSDAHSDDSSTRYRSSYSRSFASSRRRQQPSYGGEGRKKFLFFR